MHIHTLSLIALASILVTFTSATRLDKEISMVDVHQDIGNKNIHHNVYKKRGSRLLPRNSDILRRGPISPPGGIPLDTATGVLLGGGGITGGLLGGGVGGGSSAPP